MSERLPSIIPIGRKRKRPTSIIIKSYRDNRRRLLLELAKPQERWVRNNVRAYQHILRWMEEEYELP
jgi:hypothetical protein